MLQGRFIRSEQNRAATTRIFGRYAVVGAEVNIIRATKSQAYKWAGIQRSQGIPSRNCPWIRMRSHVNQFPFAGKLNGQSAHLHYMHVHVYTCNVWLSHSTLRGLACFIDLGLSMVPVNMHSFSINKRLFSISEKWAEWDCVIILATNHLMTSSRDEAARRKRSKQWMYRPVNG